MSKRAAASVQTPPIDLDLAGPGRPCPVIIDEEPDGPSAPSPDLAASSAPLVRDALPPASASSSEQEAFRRQTFDEARSTFEVSAATGTGRTYGAILRGIAPNVTLKLGSQMLPMSAEAQFLSFFGAVLLLGPTSPYPVSALPGVRWNYVKLVRAAVAHWRVVRGDRAILDTEWPPRMGFFWSGVKRKCIRSSVERSPLLFSDAHELCRKAAVSRTRRRQAVGGADLAPGGVGLGQMLERAMNLRCAAPASLAFFGERRASEIAGFRVAGAKVAEACSVVEIKARCQKNDQFGVGQVARVVALPSWGGACPDRLVSEWLWFRAWCETATALEGWRRQWKIARFSRGWLVPGSVWGWHRPACRRRGKRASTAGVCPPAKAAPGSMSRTAWPARRLKN